MFCQDNSVRFMPLRYFIQLCNLSIDKVKEMVPDDNGTYGINYFRELLESETRQLKDLCQKWRTVSAQIEIADNENSKIFLCFIL